MKCVTAQEGRAAAVPLVVMKQRFSPRDVYEHVRAEIGPPIDDGRDPSDGGDPARCAGGLVHLAHLGGRRERASNAKSSKPRNLYH